MVSVKVSRYSICTALAAVLWAQNASAADLVLYSPEPVDQQEIDLVLPAVSGINGKLELDIGAFNPPSSAVFRAAGSLSIPVGDALGVQLDVSAQNSGAGFLYGGAIHAFTRDPMAYLVGVTAAAVRSPEGTLAVAGPEAEDRRFVDHLDGTVEGVVPESKRGVDGGDPGIGGLDPIREYSGGGGGEDEQRG